MPSSGKADSPEASAGGGDDVATAYYQNLVEGQVKEIVKLQLEVAKLTAEKNQKPRTSPSAEAGDAETLRTENETLKVTVNHVFMAFHDFPFM